MILICKSITVCSCLYFLKTTRYDIKIKKIRFQIDIKMTNCTTCRIWQWVCVTPFHMVFWAHFGYLWHNLVKIYLKQTSKENLAEVGFEPTTSGLQVQCSTI